MTQTTEWKTGRLLRSTVKNGKPVLIVVRLLRENTEEEKLRNEIEMNEHARNIGVERN